MAREKTVEQTKEEILKQETVSVMIPKDKTNGSNHIWLCVNGVEMYVARGKQVKLPVAFYEVYLNSLQNDEEVENALVEQRQL